MLYEYERIIIKSKEFLAISDDLREDLSSVVQRALQCATKYRRSLKKGDRCLALHPETSKWLEVKIRQPDNGMISLQFEKTGEVRLVHVDDSNIIPLKSFEEPKEKKPRKERKLVSESSSNQESIPECSPEKNEEGVFQKYKY
jgi:hypothetical protein